MSNSIGGSGDERFSWLFKVFDQVSGPSIAGSKSLDALTSSFDKAARASSHLDAVGGQRSGLGGLRSSLADTVIVAQGVIGAVAGIANAVIDIGGSALRAGGKAFVDFNSDVEQSMISIAAVDRMFRQGHTFEDSSAAAAKFFEDYQRAAAASTATTKDFLATHQALAPTLTRLGAADEQIRNIVKGAVIAAPTLGFDASVANLDVRQLLTGNVGLRDQFATTLLQSAGVGVKEFNAKARNDPKYAIDILQMALSQPAIREASSAMENSAKGLASTFVDNFEILSGRAGKPLFDVLKSGLKGVNDWMATNRDTVDLYVKKVGAALEEGALSGVYFAKNAWAWATQPHIKEGVIAVAERVISLGRFALSAATSVYRVGESIYRIADSIGVVTLLGAAFEYIPLAIDVAGKALSQLASDLGDIFKALDIRGWFRDLGDEISSITGTVVGWFEGLGEAMGEGLIGGLASTAERLKNGVVEMADSAVSSMKDALGIHSPSKVFDEIGRFSAEGFSQGFERERPLELDLSRIALPAAPSSAPRTAPSITIQVQVDARGSDEEKAKALTDSIREQLLVMLEDLNLEGGG